jgi:mitogen-activated protein kinase
MQPSRSYYKDCHFAIDSRYRLDKRLGKGTYGLVCSARVVGDENSRPIAIKKVINIFDSVVLVKRAYREFKLMTHFRGHKNVSICSSSIERKLTKIISLLDLDFVVNKGLYSGLYCYQGNRQS